MSALHPQIPDLHSQEKSRRHILTLIYGNETLVADSLSPVLIFMENPRKSRSWESQSKPQIKLEPPAKLPSLSCSVLVSPAFDIPKCMAHYRMSARPVGETALWKKPTHHVGFHQKNTKTNPSTGKEGRGGIIFNEKESCSWLMSPCLESVCFKNALRTLVMSTVILCELQIS